MKEKTTPILSLGEYRYRQRRGSSLRELMDAPDYVSPGLRVKSAAEFIALLDELTNGGAS